MTSQEKNAKVYNMKTLLIILTLLIITAQAHATTVTLEWNAVTDPDLDHYTVYVAEKHIDSTGPWSKDQDVAKEYVTATVTVTTGIHHAFYVTATDTSGNESQASNVASTSDRIPPSGPENNRITSVTEP